MTFDPAALLAYLESASPTASVAALAQAFAVRPDLFGGGHLTGSKRDKLALPDGRVFDLVFASGGPPGTQRWQAIDVTNDPGAAPDPFALEDGPLAYLDPVRVTIDPAGAFTDLVARELGDAAGYHGAIDAGTRDLGDAATQGADVGADTSADDAAASLGAAQAALDGLAPDDARATLDGLAPLADAGTVAVDDASGALGATSPRIDEGIATVPDDPTATVPAAPGRPPGSPGQPDTPKPNA